MKIIRGLKSRIVALVATVVMIVAVLPAPASAGTLGQAFLRLDRMEASATTGGTVCAAASAGGAGTEATVKVTFPSGFTVNGTASNWTVTTTNLPSGGSAWPGIGTASLVSGQAVTFPSSNLTDTQLYCFNFSGTSTLTNGSTGSDKTGTIITQATGPSTIDTGNYATATITDDQIDVSATVPSTFNFAISGTTDALGSLATNSVTSSPTPRTVTIGTNAPNGYIVWIKDSNAGLTSTLASDTINTSGTVDDACSSAYSTGTEFYGLDADETSDPQTNGAIDAEYNCSATTVGAYSTTYTELATGTGPTAGYVITLNNRAAASTLNEAATDYADIITISGAGNF